MASRFALLAMAALALGGEYEPKKYGTETTTLLTYTTTTVCPVTSTVTSEGSHKGTYWKTDLTTSTLTVTERHGCGGAVTTVPGPVVTGHTTKLIEVTYTSLCPVTETITGPESTYVTTKIVTSDIVTKVPTTIYESVPGPKKTHTATDFVYTTLISLCPVTKVTTIAGEERTVTYTSTSLIETTVPTTVEETVKLPDHTATATDVEYKTITSLCPVTETTTIAGKEYTTTYTTTSLIKTTVPKIIKETHQLPDTTATATDVEYSTMTSLCPVTEVTTISGRVHTKTYTTPSLIKTAIHVTKHKTVTQPDTEKTATDVEYATMTKVYPVTQITTIGGQVYTKTYTTTKFIETAIHTTVQETITKPDTTATATDYEYATVTKVYPVTQVTTIEGEECTITYTTTKLVETEVPVTVQTTVQRPSETETATDVEYQTVTKAHAVTQVVTVGGEKQTVTFTSTKIVKIHQENTVYKTVTKPGEVETKTQVVYETESKGYVFTKTVEVPGAGSTEIVYKTSKVEGSPSTAQPELTTSAPSRVPTAAARTNGVPVVALVAGVAGIMAVL